MMPVLVQFTPLYKCSLALSARAIITAAHSFICQQTGHDMQHVQEVQGPKRRSEPAAPTGFLKKLQNHLSES